MRLLTLEEAAAVARVSTRLLRQEIAARRGPRVTRLGRGHSRPMVTDENLEAWIRERTETAPGGAAAVVE